MVELTEKELDELKVLFRNKYVQKLLDEKMKETDEMDRLSSQELHTQEGLNKALINQGVVAGRIEILDEMRTLAEKEDGE